MTVGGGWESAAGIVEPVAVVALGQFVLVIRYLRGTERDANVTAHLDRWDASVTTTFKLPWALGLEMPLRTMIHLDNPHSRE
jgi:hypothetical protein